MRAMWAIGVERPIKALDPSRPNPWEAAGHAYRPESQFDN